MAKEPFLPLFFGDFLGATSEWEGEEQALYLLLLGYQWSLGSLPSEPRRICKLVRWDWALFERCWETVGQKFAADDGRVRNARLEAHRQKSIELSKQASQAGRAGADARWHKPHGTKATAKKRDGDRINKDGAGNASATKKDGGSIADAMQNDGGGHAERYGDRIDSAIAPSHPIPSHPDPSINRSQDPNAGAGASAEVQSDEESPESQRNARTRRDASNPLRTAREILGSINKNGGAEADPEEIRRKALKLHDTGMRVGDIARMLHTSAEQVKAWTEGTAP